MASLSHKALAEYQASNSANYLETTSHWYYIETSLRLYCNYDDICSKSKPPYHSLFLSLYALSNSTVVYTLSHNRTWFLLHSLYPCVSSAIPNIHFHHSTESGFQLGRSTETMSNIIAVSSKCDTLACNLVTKPRVERSHCARHTTNTTATLITTWEMKHLNERSSDISLLIRG